MVRLFRFRVLEIRDVVAEAGRFLCGVLRVAHGLVAADGVQVERTRIEFAGVAVADRVPPRIADLVIVSILLGGALALAGFLLQTFFENPIAGPYVLGISSGAKMVVAIALILFMQNGMHVSSVTLIVAAFIGSLIATMFIVAVSFKIHNMAALLVAGIMVGYICNAVTEFIITFAEDSDIANLHVWSMGSFSGMSWSNVGVCLIVVGFGFRSMEWKSVPPSL